jgi:unsaturated chondroitin disaccharide hydrolase
MKYSILSACLLSLFFSVNAQKINTAKVFADAEQQSRLMLKEVPLAKKGKPELVSPKTLEKGELKLVASKDWTSGFFPGVLWFLHQYTGKPEWKREALAYTANIENEKTNGGTHDMGFKIYCSFGNGYLQTHDAHYKEVIIQAAKTLATRFNKKAGVIRSWDHHKEQWRYPVIIDNMMNLELLFEASKLSGDPFLVYYRSESCQYYYEKSLPGRS